MVKKSTKLTVNKYYYRKYKKNKFPLYKALRMIFDATFDWNLITWWPGDNVRIAFVGGNMYSAFYNAVQANPKWEHYIQLFSNLKVKGIHIIARPSPFTLASTAINYQSMVCMGYYVSDQTWSTNDNVPAFNALQDCYSKCKILNVHKNTSWYIPKPQPYNYYASIYDFVSPVTANAKIGYFVIRSESESSITKGPCWNIHIRVFIRFKNPKGPD